MKNRRAKNTKKTNPAKGMKRSHETRYWVDGRFAKPITRGFPKAEDGSIRGASNAVARGYAVKVQRVERATRRVEWTVKALPRVSGVKIVPYQVFRGDPDETPIRQRNE